jgi:hypothetical protein
VTSISSSTRCSCNLAHLLQSCGLIQHDGGKLLTDGVQRLLLLIFVILNIGQLSELVFEIWVFLLEFLFEDLLNSDTRFLVEGD